MEPDPDAPATKRDLAELRAELRQDLSQAIENQTRILAGEIARAVNVIVESDTDRFRAGDDRTTAVGGRVTELAARVDAHVADAGAHRPPRRAKR